MPISMARAARFASSRTFQRAEGAPAIERIVHKVERPDAVQCRRRDQRLAESIGHAALRPPRQMEAQGAIHTADALVIPRVPVEPQAIEALPEAPAAVIRDDRGQCRDHGRILAHPSDRRPVVRRPREPHHLAGTSDR